MKNGKAGWLSTVFAGLVLLIPLAGGGAARAELPGTVTIAKAADADSLDPKLATAAPSVWVYANIFETLVEQGTDLKVKPQLATSWEQINPTTWRFHLRKGVKFQDGTPFNAQAVKFTFDRALSTTSPARGLSMAGPVAKETVVDDDTVDISTTNPFGPTLQALSEVFVFGIVSPAAVAKYGNDFGYHPVGTGPFAFDSWDKNQQIVLKRNPDYWGGKPKIDRLVFRVIPEANSQAIAFQANEIDGIMAPDASLIGRLRADPSAHVYDIPGLRMIYLGFNTKRPVVSDVRVRQAINHAINTEAIAKGLLRGTATPASGYLPKQVFGYADVGTYKYDLAAAKNLLAQAGWKPGADGILQKDGQPLAITLWGYTGRDPSSALISQAVQGDLQKLGAKVNLRVWDYAQLSTALWKEAPKNPADTQYDMFMLGWTTVTGDADFTLYGTVSDISIPPEGLNATYWAPPDYMADLLKGRTSTDPATRLAAYKSAQVKLHDAAIWVPLVVTNQVLVLKKTVTGYTPHPVEYYMLRMNGVGVGK